MNRRWSFAGNWGGQQKVNNVHSQRQSLHLGLIPTGAVGFARSFYGPGTGGIFLDSTDCNGDEERFLDCEHSRSHDCSHFEDASVQCPFPGDTAC